MDADGTTRGIVKRRNFNSEILCGDPFTKDNWRKHNTIFITAPEDMSTKKALGDHCDYHYFKEVVLPWAQKGGLSPKSNLPQDFCKNMLNEKGWDLVANFCGEYYADNTNYIALYNKYTGILRYFYYIPEWANLNQAADHNWEVQMCNGAAEHSVFGYPVPMDRNLKKDVPEIKATEPITSTLLPK